MEKLTYKYEKFVCSLNALQKVVEVLERKDIPITILLAAGVKHFEICYEVAWKYLKLYLECKHNQKVDSPKKVFRECFNQSILNQETTHELLNIAETRNATTHDYDEETAKETFKRLAEYYITLQKLQDIIPSKRDL